MWISYVLYVYNFMKILFLTIFSRKSRKKYRIFCPSRLGALHVLLLIISQCLMRCQLLLNEEIFATNDRCLPAMDFLAQKSRNISFMSTAAYEEQQTHAIEYGKQKTFLRPADCGKCKGPPKLGLAKVEEISLRIGGPPRKKRKFRIRLD